MFGKAAPTAKQNPREEAHSMNTLALLVGPLCTFFVGYRFYSAVIAAKVLTLKDSNPTPAH